jgi:sterol desaturase/sphingolipid hydroxylase (fatty acid hydroxylase superfamily)
MEKWILLGMGPVFLLLIGWEAWYWRRRRPDTYRLVDTLSNAGLALMHQAADAVAWVLVIGVYYAVYRFRVFDWPATWWSIAALFVLQDFLYYFFHRASHRVRWLWASHVVHHSSERLNLSTAFRQSLTYPVSGMWVFWLPLAWLGFEPAHIVAVVAINLGFQFFVHTQAVGKLGWLEYVVNTPSTHRVHHARNPVYIDRNYAGVLVVWDRLFGSYVPEDPAVPCEYGIVGQVQGHNPLKLTFHEWIAMARDVRRAGSLRAALGQLVCPPERALSHPARQAVAAGVEAAAIATNPAGIDDGMAAASGGTAADDALRSPAT